MLRNPVWTYQVLQDGKPNLTLQKKLQKESQPALSFLCHFDVYANNNMVCLYQEIPKWKAHLDEQAAEWALGILRSGNVNTENISIKAELLLGSGTQLK